MTASLRILGLDPGLRRTGWGVIESAGSQLRHVAHGTIQTKSDQSDPERLAVLHQGLAEVIAEWAPQSAAIEKTFVNKDPVSALKLGHARGIALLAPALVAIEVAEYAPNLVKKSIVGNGHATKEQISTMIGVLLPSVKVKGFDAADALAIAICHAHHRGNALARRKAAQDTKDVSKGSDPIEKVGFNGV